MPRVRAVLPTVLAALAGLAAGGAGPAAAGPSLPLGQHGRWITDADGRVVVLHGVNMVAKRPPYAPSALGFGRDDARWLAREGFTTVRLGIIPAALEPRPGVYDDAYLAGIAATVRVLHRAGIVTLLDAHQDLFNERFQGEGFPDWAVQDDGLPAEPRAGFPLNYLRMPALQRAFDHFWADDPGPGGVGIQTRFAAAWRHVAARLRGRPGILGYDLLNEPWPGTDWAPCAAADGCPGPDARLTAFTRRVTRAIRREDRRVLVFAEPHVLFNFGAASHLGDAGPRMGLSFHDYCLSASDPGQAAACAAADERVWANAERLARANGDALLLTEFGATGDPAVLGPMLERADRHMVGWQFWHFCGCGDPTTSGPGDEQALVRDPARPPRGANVDRGKLGQLARPYPRVVAGTPLGWSLRRGVFRAAWSTARVAGGGRAAGRRFGPRVRSELAIPRRRFPRGYVARVRGGRVVSRPGARVLRVRARTGAQRVRLVVRPR